MIQINKDVYFGKYGDLQFGTGDLRTINTPTEIVKQNVIDRVRSSMSDYLNENPAVANLQSLIGRTDDLAIERGAEKQKSDEEDKKVFKEAYMQTKANRAKKSK